MRKKLLWFLAVLFIACAMGLWQIGRARSFQFFGILVPRIDTAEKVVALTFDDGPTPRGTEELLQVLSEKQVKATFYLIGGELEQHPEEGRRIVTAGHEVGNHSYSHTRMILVSPSFVQKEIETTDRLLRATGYDREITFRPPYCKKLFALPWYLSKTGRKTVTWDVEPDSDAVIAADADKIVAATRASVRPGSIILLHAMYPNRRPSLQAVRGIIETLTQDGYRFVTVTELLRAERSRTKS